MVRLPFHLYKEVNHMFVIQVHVNEENRKKQKKNERVGEKKLPTFDIEMERLCAFCSCIEKTTYDWYTHMTKHDFF